MSEQAEKMVVFRVAVPVIYTADLEDLREYQDDFDSESDWLLNCIGEPGVCRLRVETSGEKEGTVAEVWGQIEGAELVPADPHLTDDDIARRGISLLRDEGSCEFCDFDTNCAQEDRGHDK